MARLKHFLKKDLVGTLELAEGRYVAGRNDDCDVVLASPQSSREHFRLTTRAEGGALLEDMNSANGTFVDGIREYRKTLTRRAIIQVGDDMIVFVPGDEESTASKLPFWASRSDERDTRSGRGGEFSTRHVPPAVQRRSHADERIQTRPHLLFSTGTSTRTLSLDSEVTTIGHGAVTVSLDRNATGKKNVLAEIVRKSQTEFVVRAKGVFSRIRVNGKACASARLETGDTIVVGGETLRFHLGLLDEEGTSG